MRLILPLALLLSATACRGQEKQPPKPDKPAVAAAPVDAFEKKYGPLWVDLAFAVAQTRDGGFILAGDSEKVDDRYQGDYDAMLVRVDPAGERVWSESYGEVDAVDRAADVIEVDGGFIAAGFVTVDKSKRAWIARVDAQGKIVWEARLGDAGKEQVFTALTSTSRGGVFAVGSTTAAGGKADLLIMAFDLNGKTLWTREHGTEETDRATGVAVAPDGTILICGYTYSSRAGDGWLVAFDPAGELRWSNSYGGAGDDWFEDLALLPDGGVALVGVTESEGAGKRDGWLVVTDAAGTVKADKTFGSPEKDELKAVTVRPDGHGLALAGKTEKSGLPEAWLVLAGLDGAPERERTFGDNRRVANDAAYATDGALLLAGDWATNNSNYGNFWLWKGKP